MDNLQTNIKKLLTLTEAYELSNIRTILDSAPTDQKGDLFEEYLAELYKGNGWLAQVTGEKGDAGADLLLRHPETPEKVSIVIQAKNHKIPLTFDNTKIELIKFEEQAKKKYKCDSYSIVCINGYVKEALKLNQFNMSLLDWRYITELIKNYDKSNTTKPRLELIAHNLNTYNKTKELFKTKQRVSTIQATGTGKSYLIGQHLLDNVDKQCLVLAPSIFILEQQQRLLPWLTNVAYMTYSKASYSTCDDWSGIKPEFIVLDEFHRGGADKWGDGLQRLFTAAPDAKVFGTTATHIRYLDNARNMADELFEGTIANEITLQEAIARNILPAPYYVSALYSFKEEVEQIQQDISNCKATFEDRESATEEITRLAVDWESSSGVPDILDKHLKDVTGKFIVFCEDIESMDVMQDEVSTWFRKAAKKRNQTVKRKSYIIQSQQTDSENKTTIKEFTNESTDKSVHILLAVNMLNEGLHIKGISGVILLRKTTSPIIYFQQIGRCLQVNGGLQPVIFDLVNNMANVQSQHLQESIEKAIDIEQEKRNELGLPTLSHDLHIIDETYDLKLKLDEVERRLGMDLNSFDRGFKMLVDYKEEYGHCIVPSDYKNNSEYLLGSWCNNNRNAHNIKALSQEKIERLNELGFVWNKFDHFWSIGFEALKTYKNEYGDTFVPNKYVDSSGFNLGSWVATQRYNSRKKIFNIDKEKLLNSIGFTWDIEQALWNENLKDLAVYVKQHGHAKVPRKYLSTNNRSLGHWLSSQNVLYKKEQLSDLKINQLLNFGVIFNPFEIMWEDNFIALENYFEEFGDSLVPREYITDKGIKLGDWVNNIRKKHSKNTITSEQINKLNSLKFVWNCKALEVTIGLRELNCYIQDNGDSFVPTRFKTDSGYSLGRWVTTCRKNFLIDKIEPELAKQLNEIGFVWDALDYRWEKAFDSLVSYEKEHGHCKVPQKYIDVEGIALGAWVSTCRTNYYKNKLAPERVTKLESINFKWKN
jgi:superfamily II DNA or RNA helicase